MDSDPVGDALLECPLGQDREQITQADRRRMPCATDACRRPTFGAATCIYP
jgi:hypothetical protein